MEGDAATTATTEVPSTPALGVPEAKEDNILVQGWWVNIIGLILVVILGALWTLARKFMNKILDKMDATETEKQAIDALLAGMAEQQPIANGIKKAAADNKITATEAKALEAAALATAKELATGPAKDLLLSWSEKKVSSVIKQLLAKFKSK